MHLRAICDLCTAQSDGIPSLLGVMLGSLHLVSCLFHHALQGTAFPSSERERLGLRGLLPTRCVDMSLQVRLNRLQFSPSFLSYIHRTFGYGSVLFPCILCSQENIISCLLTSLRKDTLKCMKYYFCSQAEVWDS